MGTVYSDVTSFPWKRHCNRELEASNIKMENFKEHSMLSEDAI